MFDRFMAVGAALALSLCGADAMASAHASARLSDLRIVLVAYGSAAPSVTFTVTDGSVASTMTYSVAQGLSTVDASHGGGAFAAATCVSLDSAALGSVAQIAGDPFGGGANARLQALAGGGPAQAEGSASLGDGNNYASFTLSPDTLMVITGMADLEAGTSGTLPDDYAIASIDLQLSGSHGDSAQNSAAHSLAVAGGVGGTLVTRHM